MEDVEKKPKKMYFDEKMAQECILRYQESKDMNDLAPLYHQFVAQANGMLNKQFYANDLIKDNRDDAIAYAIYEIYKSLQRFTLEKGKVFPYSNRIIKNTFLMYYQKLLKHSCEMSIHELQNSNNDENSDDDIFGYVNDFEKDPVVCKSGYSGNPIKIFDHIGPESDEINIEDMQFVYFYFKSISDKLNILLNDKKELNSLILAIQENLEEEIIPSETNKKKSITNLFQKEVSLEAKYKATFKAIQMSIQKLLDWITDNYKIDNNITVYRSNAYLTLPKALMKKITLIKNNIFKTNLPDYVKSENLVSVMMYIDKNY